MSTLDVAIINCATKTCDIHVHNLTKTFGDSYFHVTVVNPKNCQDLLATKEILESFRGSDNPLLILKDSSICQLSSKSLAKMIQRALKHAHDNHIDLLYLCSAGDKCDKQTDLLYFDDGTRLRTSDGNKSTQALLYTRKARRLIIKQLVDTPLSLNRDIPDIIREKVQSGELKVALFSPNIVHFDLEMAKSKEEYASSNVCAATQSESSSTGMYVWFIILIILIILVAWGLVQINPRFQGND